jgi:nicotinate phosphoribosyltransferase
MSKPATNFHFPLSGLYTDMYELTMAQAYFREDGHLSNACFDYFFRKLPFAGGFVVFCGLDDVLGEIENLRFTCSDLHWLQQQGLDEKFVSWLETFRFKGTIYAVNEGATVFPTEPLLFVEGNLIEVQLIETLLLNFLNFQSLIATKAARMRLAAGPRHLSEFGLRRAQSLGGIYASKAAVSGGFDSTSNALAAQRFGMKAVGTMAHSFVQSYEDELTAFRKFAEAHPQNCTLLVDTYDTLKSGVRNAIIVAKELAQKGGQLQAIRLDSGDLAYLSKKCRQVLDSEGLQSVQIVVSNQLDENVIKSLLDQHAPIDMFGVGTSIAAGQPDAALDGVYKLNQVNGTPRIKLSENLQKITLPGKKQVYRYTDENGFFSADAIVSWNDPAPGKMVHPFDPEKYIILDPAYAQPLLHKVMENGKKIIPSQSPQEVAAYCSKQLQQLPEEHKRFNNPHIYKIGISEPLQLLRNDLRKRYKK